MDGFIATLMNSLRDSTRSRTLSMRVYHATE